MGNHPRPPNRGEASWVYEKRGRKVGGGALTVAQGSLIVNLVGHNKFREFGSFRLENNSFLDHQSRQYVIGIFANVGHAFWQ